MPEVMIRNLKNEEVRKLQLPDAVFSAPMKEHLVYEAAQVGISGQTEDTVEGRTAILERRKPVFHGR